MTLLIPTIVRLISEKNIPKKLLSTDRVLEDLEQKNNNYNKKSVLNLI